MGNQYGLLIPSLNIFLLAAHNVRYYIYDQWNYFVMFYINIVLIKILLKIVFLGLYMSI